MKRGFNDYRVENGIAFLVLTNLAGAVTGETLIDASDLPMLKEMGGRWRMARNPWGFHVLSEQKTESGQRTTVYLHRFLLGNPKSHVDHVNRDTLDNRKCNLRRATPSQNGINRGLDKQNTSGFKGIWKKRKRWAAAIMVDGKRIHLGVHDTPEEAAMSYDEAAKKAYGEYAYLNFPRMS